jgi:predicted permease
LTRQASAAAAQPRLTRWFIGAQIAVALALVTLAALLWSSARRFITDGHFDPLHVALLRVEPHYPPERTKAFLRAVVEQLESLPGVVAASLFDTALVLHGESVTVSRSEGLGPGRRVVQASKKGVGPRYFEVLGTPLLRGRDFEARDSLHSPRVAIVGESLGRALWPDGEPIGSTLVVENGPPMTVVGIVADVSASLRGQPRTSHLYIPFWQVPGHVATRLCVRVQGEPAAALPMLVRTVNSIDPQVPVTETMSMATQVAATDELKAVRMTAAIAAYAAAFAVVVAAVGIYGTLTFSVARRTKEIAVRVAVGGGPKDIFALIVKEEMMIVLAGTLVGMALAWGASRVLRHLLFLYGADSGDSLLYVSAALLIMAVGLLACWFPARRVSRLDPVSALKAE